MTAKFWVGGNGTWDGSNTANWSLSTGGASGAAVPGPTDTVKFDAASGGGTCTVNTNVNVISLDWAGYASGTIDFSVNNNNCTLTNAGSNAFLGSSGTTRAFKAGNGIFTINGVMSMGTTTGLTWTPGNASWVIDNAGVGNSGHGFANLTYNSVEFKGSAFGYLITNGTPTTITTLIVDAGAMIFFGNGNQFTVTNVTSNGTLGSPASIISNHQTNKATISKASGTMTVANMAFTRIIFSGGATFIANNSFDLGGNTGITINSPAASNSGGAIGAAVIGG
jgi:hypothetical protein